jgi:hypothetical protein
VLRAALRRIAAILAVMVGGTAAVSAALGALAGKSILHSLAVGYYVAAAAVLIGCFVTGARGPLRRDSRDDGAEVPAVPPSMFSSNRSPLRRRNMRKATPEERRESRLISLGLFALGLVLILIGSVLDPSRHAF